MPDRLLQRVAVIVDCAVGELGAALGGGNALWAHGVVDRPTADLDTFLDGQSLSLYDQAEKALVGAFDLVGMDATVLESDSWFRGFIVTDRSSGEAVRVDINYSHRDYPPVTIKGVGAVLHLEDILLGKLKALTSRTAERLADVWASVRAGDPVEYQALGMTPRQVDHMFTRLEAHAEAIRDAHA